MKVLLVVDVQNGFCPGGELAVPGGDQIVPIVNELMKSGAFDHIIATKDWHPADHKSFAVNHEGRKPYEVIQLGDVAQVLWPVHCAEETKSAEFHPALDATRIEKVIVKGTNPEVDSYSGFFDNDGRSETPLRAYLEGLARQHGESLEDIELTVCGLATDYCVAFTARDAKLRLGLDVTLVVDACRAVNLKPDDEVRTLRELAAIGVKLASARDILVGPERNREPAREIAAGI